MFQMLQNILCFNYTACVGSGSPFEFNKDLKILKMRLKIKLLDKLHRGRHKYFATAKAVPIVMQTRNIQYLKWLKLFAALNFLQNSINK